MEQQAAARYLGGHSIESVAEAEQSDVKLTKFNSIKPTNDWMVSKVNHTRCSLDQLSAALDEGLARGSSREQLVGSSTVDLSRDLSGQHPDSPRARQHHDAEPFRIVWRKLSFEVDTFIYNRLFGKINAWPGDRTTSGRNFEEQANEGQPDPSKRSIFRNLNGCANSGEILAIIGPSGAGKTSLLNALCGQTSNYSGSIHLLGGGQRAKKLRLSIIPQKDYLVEQLTVRESLLYASRLLNANKSVDHEANIRRVVTMLNLTDCLESSVAKISGGEYKRVSIAQELLNQPDILILDEPTSGLDSLNCKNLIRSLAALIEFSRRGQIKPIAVVLTIHQPDAEVFNMFDRVYCMALGGLVIYDGHPRDAMSLIRAHAQFDELNRPAELGETQNSGPEPSSVAINPASMLIELASGVYGDKPIESLARLQRKQFEALDQRPFHIGGQERSGPQNQHRVAGDNQDSAATLADNPTMSPSGPKASPFYRDKRLSSQHSSSHANLFLYHTRILTSRAFLATARDPFITIVSLLFYTSIPFVMYTVYSRDIGSAHACPMVVREFDLLSVTSNQTLGVVERLQEQLSVAYECANMFFVTIYSFCMCSIALAALAFPVNMHVLLKEVRNGWYDLGPSVMAKTIASFPLEVLFPVLSILLIYAVLDMPSSPLHWRPLAIASVVALLSMIGQTTGLICGALCMDSVQTAIFLGLSSTIPQALVSGYVARVKQMPWLLAKLSWFSPLRYSNEMVNMIRFGFNMCPCDPITDEYLRNQRPEFKDVPARMSSFVTYFLKDTLSEELDVDASSPDAMEPGTTTPSTVLLFANDTGSGHVPGISYQFNLNQSERRALLDEINSNKVNILRQLADQMTRSFAYGETINGCSDVRAQILNIYDSPPDHELPVLFAYLIGLLVAFKIVLYLVVKFKIGSLV